MKNVFTLFALMFMVLTLNAQYIYNDFDANQNVDFTGWPNVPALVANPDPSGINPSANVGEWVRSEEQWAHVYAILDGYINFETGTNFQMKVYSPIACEVLFKLEDQNNPGVFVEVMGNVTTPNVWEQLVFDFTGTASGTYDKIVIFFDFATTNDNTFYFDDVEGPEIGSGVEPKPLLALDVQDNFENDGWATIIDWVFQDPDLLPLPIVIDPVNASNHVADYNRSGTFEWTNAQFVLDHRMDLSERNTFTVDVYFPSSNDYSGSLTPTAALKLQNSLLGGNAWTTQTEIVNTVEQFDEWVTLSFDFSSVSDSVNYDQVVVQIGGEGHLEAGQFYFDDFVLLGGTSIDETSIETLQIYPNPVSNVLQFNTVSDIQSATIYNLQGQIIKTPEANNGTLDVSNLRYGFYILRIVASDGKVSIGEFIKQ